MNKIINISKLISNIRSSYTTRKAAYDEQSHEFINSCNKDFYANLVNYIGYWNNPFVTESFSVLDLISIAECYTIDTHKSKLVVPLDIKGIINIVRYRLSLSKKYGDQAQPLLNDMLCVKLHEKILMHFKGDDIDQF